MFSLPGHCTTDEAGSNCTETWVTCVEHKSSANPLNSCRVTHVSGHATHEFLCNSQLKAKREHAVAVFIPAFGQYIEQGEDCRTSASSSVTMNCEDSDGCSFEEMSDELCAVRDLNMASRLCDADDDPKVGGSLGSLYS